MDAEDIKAEVKRGYLEQISRLESRIVELTQDLKNQRSLCNGCFYCLDAAKFKEE